MLFARQAEPGLLILFGVLVTLCNNWLSYAFHGYQAELFPTRIRSRAVGFVYSWSRLSAAFSGLAVGFFLTIGGVEAVFGFIAAAMVIVVVSIGGVRPAHPQPCAGGDLARRERPGADPVRTEERRALEPQWVGRRSVSVFRRCRCGGTR